MISACLLAIGAFTRFTFLFFYFPVAVALLLETWDVVQRMVCLCACTQTIIFVHFIAFSDFPLSKNECCMLSSPRFPALFHSVSPPLFVCCLIPSISVRFKYVLYG